MFIFASAIINRFITVVWNYHIMKQKRILLVGGQYLVPFILITSLFFLWGFAHAILNVLNKHFQEILDITKAHSAFIQMMMYMGYFIMAIPAGLFISRFGYRLGGGVRSVALWYRFVALHSRTALFVLQSFLVCTVRDRLWTDVS